MEMIYERYWDLVAASPRFHVEGFFESGSKLPWHHYVVGGGEDISNRPALWFSSLYACLLLTWTLFKNIPATFP